MKRALQIAFGLMFALPAPATKAQLPPRKDIPAIAKAAKGAIVTIVTAVNDKPIALGTGFLVRADGVILTNYHVIRTGNVAAVKFSDETVLPVDGVLAADKVRDLAIIKVHGKTFRTLTLGNSDQIQVGEEVVAIGNPLGLELTVSNGILSGVRTDKEVGGKFLQVTAPITHGSSGGPLFNMMGEVVGITTLGIEGGGNLNFAIPINDAKHLLQNQSATLRDLPNEPDSDASIADTPKVDAPTERPSDTTSPRERECGLRAEKFIRYESQKRGSTIEAYTVHYDGRWTEKDQNCYVEVASTVHFNGEIATQYIIRDVFFEGDGGPVYGKCVFGRNGRIIKGARCSVSTVGSIEEKGLEFLDTKCRSEEEFNEMARTYLGITPPPHRTRTSSQPTFR